MSANMRCPYCGSTDVECTERNRRHEHLCHRCEAIDKYYVGADDLSRYLNSHKEHTE